MDTVERMRVRVVSVVVAAMLVSAAGCSGAPTRDSSPGTDMTTSTAAPATDSASHSVPPTGTATAGPPTETVSQAPTTVLTTPTDPTPIAPPPSTAEPAPVVADCPYLSTADVADANGQRIATTQIIATEPYPICEFFRPDGTVLAVTRIVVADTPEAATAAVNQHVPVDESFPVTRPSGWTGGAMATPNGLPEYPDAGSIYAVSKGTIAVIAISNQKQSIKGRQMVTDIVTNLGL